MTFSRDYFQQTLTSILAVDSPTGYTHHVIAKLAQLIEGLGYTTTTDNKGNLSVVVAGTIDKHIGVSAHVDTLGLMVRSINGDGTLSFTKLGGPSLPTLDGEYCTIYTRGAQRYEGTVLSNSPSVHVYTDANTRPRDEQNMHIRLDELVSTKADVEALGIDTGDIIAYDPKLVFTPQGFIKSRFLDDKLSVALIVTLLKDWADTGTKPTHTVHFMFSTYEEVGHGLSHIPSHLSEVLALDMGCIGNGLTCTEREVSICAKDSSGPYDYELTSKLIELAKAHKLGYAVDIYPMYGSDVSAAQRGGNDIRGALIGAGVAASHGMERSHMDGAENTYKLLYLYTTTA